MKIFDYPELLEGDEELLLLNRACKKFKPPVSEPTIWRFASIGVRDAVLRTILIGSRRYTTESEIRRFTLAQLQNPAPGNATDKESTCNVPKRPKRKIGNGMTQAEIEAGLARHGLNSVTNGTPSQTQSLSPEVLMKAAKLGLE